MLDWPSRPHTRRARHPKFQCSPALPFQIVRKHLVDRGGGVFPVALGVIVRLSLTFRSEVHSDATSVVVLQLVPTAAGCCGNAAWI
jgi:hypothetical protein